MKTKKVNGPEQDELSLMKLAREYSDEDKARTMLESLRWKNGPVCPHCQNHKEKPIYTLKPKAGSTTRQGVYKCGACRMQFSVLVGSIFEGSHIRVSTWLQAIFILCAAKKSISAHQLHRMLGITYKSAWFLLHRLRHAMGPEMPLAKMLSGTVECDETFIGPKSDPANCFKSKKQVVALIERGGEMRAQVVSNITQKKRASSSPSM